MIDKIGFLDISSFSFGRSGHSRSSFPEIFHHAAGDACIPFTVVSFYRPNSSLLCLNCVTKHLALILNTVCNETYKAYFLKRPFLFP